jgi:hypothetical protein
MAKVYLEHLRMKIPFDFAEYIFEYLKIDPLDTESFE